ncbi:MAG: hypothetical protein ACRC4M_04860 [Mycoplasma sp.]
MYRVIATNPQNKNDLVYYTQDFSTINETVYNFVTSLIEEYSFFEESLLNVVFKNFGIKTNFDPKKYNIPLFNNEHIGIDLIKKIPIPNFTSLEMFDQELFLKIISNFSNNSLNWSIILE